MQDTFGKGQFQIEAQNFSVWPSCRETHPEGRIRVTHSISIHEKLYEHV